MKILAVGHNTFRITLADGTALLTDPWFQMNRLWRKVPPALAPDQLGTIAIVLASHNHLDHIDRPSLELARRQGAAVIGSLRVAARARKFGIADVTALAPGDKKKSRGFSIRAAPAFHPLARDAVGFLIRAEGRQLYFSGDTRLHPDLIKFLKAAGPIDLAFLQVACARYFGKDDGLDLTTAALLADFLKLPRVVPMHLDATLKKKCDLTELRKLMADAGAELWFIPPGEEVEVFNAG